MNESMASWQQTTGQRYVLSYEQQRLWFVNQLTPAASAYNIPCAARIYGPLDYPALNRTLTEIVRRHEVLRTKIELEDDQPVQVVLAPETIQPDLLDVTGERDVEEQLTGLMALELGKPFDLRAGPLFRASLFRLAESEHVLMLTMHHLASDGWSIGILVREFAALYENFVMCGEARLPELNWQYGDYAKWQHEWLESPDAQELFSYWKDQLQGVPPAISLRSDQAPPTRTDLRAATCSAEIGPQATSTLRKLGYTERCTLPITLLGSIVALLSRLTAQEDVILGSTVAKRSRLETECLIGFFVNVIALRATLSGNPTFRDLLRRVRDTSFGAYAHQELPFDRIVEMLRPDRNTPEHPFFATLFNYQSVSPVSLQIEKLQVVPIRIEQQEFHYPVCFTVEDYGERLRIEVLYQTALFSSDSIRCVVDQWVHLLEQIVTNPDQQVSGFSLVTPSTVDRLPDPGAELAAREYESVTTAVLRIAKEHPDRPAIKWGNRVWSYARFAERSIELANNIANNLSPGEALVIVGQKSYGLIASIVGAILAGAVVTLFDPRTPVLRKQEICRQARPRYLLQVVDNGRVEPEDEVAGVSTVGVVDAQTAGIAEWRGASASPSLPALGLQDPAYLVFTSGTTGSPKGVIGRHGGLNHFVTWEREAFAICGTDMCPQLAGLSVDVIYREIFAVLSSGACLCLPMETQESDPNATLAWLQEIGTTIFHAVPSIVQNWLAEMPSGASLPRLRWAFLVGEPLSDGLVRKWRAAFPNGEIVNLYGATETNFAKCFHVVPPEPAPGNQPAGRPLPETQVLVLKSDGRLCGIGEPGDIVFRTPFLSAGYINETEEGNSKFSGITYRIGDRGIYLPDGSLQLLGRADRQIKINGMRVEPEETAAVLATHPDVIGCFVKPDEDGSGRKSLTAYVVVSNKTQTEPSMLQSYVGSRLPSACVPSQIIFVDLLPVNDSGKIDESKLPPPTGSKTRGRPNSILITASQELLVDIWRKVLGRDQIDLDDDFFEMGGHSLLATRVVSRVRRIFGAQLSLGAIFAFPTVRSLACEVDREMAGSALTRSPITRRPSGGDLPLSYAQQRLWFLDQLEPGNAAYNIPAAARLIGQLDRKLLERAFAEITRRHEALRTRFEMAEDGRGVQVIEPSMGRILEETDLRGKDDIEELIRCEAEAEALRPFDLSRGPLLRARLLVLGEQEHVLLLTMHHIVSDGWSMGVLIRELGTIYGAHIRGEKSPLPELEIQYGDYAVWQRDWLQGTVLEEQMRHWRAKLSGELPEMDLPMDRQRTELTSSRGANKRALLTESLRQNVERLSREESVTPFMTLLAGLLLVLNRYSGQTDLIVGTPIAGRSRVELEPLIGFFVNTLPLRVNLSGNPSFQQLLARIRDTALEAYCHQDLPFDMLVEHIRPERRLNRNPLFEVMFQFDDVSALPQPLQHLRVESLDVLQERAKVDLFLMVKTSQGHYELTLQYRADVFSSATMQRMLELYESSLENAVKDPAASLLECTRSPVAKLERLKANFAGALES